MIKPVHLLLSLLVPFFLNAQLPNTDVWLFKIAMNDSGKAILKDPLNITKRKGYDNQPTFSSDGKKIYYVSVREDEQADIYAYDLKSKVSSVFAKTQESEYSPQISEDEKYIESVVVEKDSSQRIHSINLITAMDEKKLEFDSVGYYCNLNEDTLVYYKLTAPHSLRYYVKSSREDERIGLHPIRGFKKVNRHTLIYGLKDSAKVEFYTYNFLLKKAIKYAEYPSLNEDIFWHQTWGLLKSEGSLLLRFDEKQNQWLVLFDLTQYGISKITRLIFDHKNLFLAIVNNY